MTKMKLIFVVCVAAAVSGTLFGYQIGYRKAKDEIPSCLYLKRPRANDVKPWGYDGKEGIDWYCDDIFGGGLYVSLHKWKRGW